MRLPTKKELKSSSSNFLIALVAQCGRNTTMSRARLSGQPVTWVLHAVSPRAGKSRSAFSGFGFPAGIAVQKSAMQREQYPMSESGGGGVGVSGCRSYAGGVIRRQADPSGGGKRVSTEWVPRMQRVQIGIDDTHIPEKGASWTLAHKSKEQLRTKRPATFRTPL